eukprot:5302471-Pyramimonas_sp.AAC.1
MNLMYLLLWLLLTLEVGGVPRVFPEWCVFRIGFDVNEEDTSSRQREERASALPRRTYHNPCARTAVRTACAPRAHGGGRRCEHEGTPFLLF